uniref:Uncharacterized protein n=1 Tax=Strongyloides venezuelensis TaxID=75913 RepID=A0A0K0G014_STRVS
MFVNNKDIIIKRTTELKQQNANLKRETEKQMFEISKQEEIYQKEFKRLLELQLKNERMRKEIEKVREINNNIKKKDEDMHKLIEDATNSVCHSINENLLQSSTQPGFIQPDDLDNLRKTIDSAMEKFNLLFDDSSEEKWLKMKDKLLADLRVKEMMFNEMVNKLENVRARCFSRNPTQISGNTWEMLLDEMKQSMFVTWYKFTEEEMKRNKV